MNDFFLSYLIAINLVAFIVFGIDKYKAIKNKWRIPEKSLFGLALLGGSIGAMLGMKVFHHKVAKRTFYLGIPAIFILQLLAVGYYYY